MSSVNRIILARGPNGSNLDKIIDTKENVGAQNEMILDSNYDLSANINDVSAKNAIASQVLTGSNVPTNNITPAFIGQIFIDISDPASPVVYMAHALSNSDWIQISI